MLRHLKEAFDDFRHALRRGGSTSGAAPAEQTGVETIEVTPTTTSAPAPALPAAAAKADQSTPGEPAPEPIGAAPAAAEPVRAGRPRWIRTLAVAGLVVLALVVLRWAPWGARDPADPAVVATYQGGVVTREQLRRQFEAMPKAEQRVFRTPDGLRVLVGHAVVHEATRRWAEQKQLDQKGLFKDAMKHATENIQIADVSDQLHRGRIQVGEAEIQAYYDQNRQWFGERPLVEVKEEIRQAVVEQKEQAFVAAYLKDLKERASLQVDYSLLEVPEAAESELLNYYRTNRERFRVPEQAKIAQIQVSVSLAGTDTKARAKAESARARAAAGEDFAQLAREISDGAEKGRGGELATPVARGSRNQAFDEAVFPLPLGGLSAVFKEGDSYYVVKLLEQWPERLRPYEEGRGEIASLLWEEREQQVYQERASRTLISIHGRRTTLGEFVHELNELPPAVQMQYSGPEGKRELLDALIDRLLVVEDASEQAIDVKRQEDIQHARSNLLARLLHQEEVDEQVKVSDAEVRAEYERNKARYAEPPQVKVRYIRVSRGLTRSEDEKARAKIEEAEAKLKPGGLFRRGGQPADFAEVARQSAGDVAVGELDRWIGESGDPIAELFEHPLHQELLPLKVGDFSPILPLDDSYYLFQIRDKQEARQRSFEEAQSLVRRHLEARKHEELSRQMERSFLERMQLQIYDSRIQSVLEELGGPAAGRR